MIICKGGSKNGQEGPFYDNAMMICKGVQKRSGSPLYDIAMIICKGGGALYGTAMIICEGCPITVKGGII